MRLKLFLRLMVHLFREVSPMWALYYSFSSGRHFFNSKNKF